MLETVVVFCCINSCVVCRMFRILSSKFERSNEFRSRNMCGVLPLTTLFIVEIFCIDNIVLAALIYVKAKVLFFSRQLVMGVVIVFLDVTGFCFSFLVVRNLFLVNG